jgi:hypothetical protein
MFRIMLKKEIVRLVHCKLYNIAGLNKHAIFMIGRLNICYFTTMLLHLVCSKLIYRYNIILILSTVNFFVEEYTN